MNTKEQFYYDNRKRIGERVAELRVRKGVTQIELAEMSGVTRQNITKIEHGRYNVSVDILEKILRPLGATIDVVERE